MAVRQTIMWLDQNGIPYWDLCFMKEKDQVGADIYIEDSPSNLERLRSRGHYAICFANSTNKHIADPKASNWDEVHALIKAWQPERREAC
jgi:5'(3')-deoxyribonucleotidase